MHPLRLRINIVRLPTYMPKNTLEANAGDVANKCETALVGTLGRKANGVGTVAGVLRVIETSATVLGMCPGRRTHKCDPPVATGSTVVTNTPKQRPWKEPRLPVPTLCATHATQLLI